MKKKFSKLSKRTQEKVESQYHRMKARDFDATMLTATRQRPNIIRLPNRLIQRLKTLADRKGDVEYQTIVKNWIEERLRQETKPAR